MAGEPPRAPNLFEDFNNSQALQHRKLFIYVMNNEP